MPTQVKFLNTIECAKVLRKTEAALAVDRCRGKGPDYIKLGRKILYPLPALRKYLRANYTQLKNY